MASELAYISAAVLLWLSAFGMRFRGTEDSANGARLTRRVSLVQAALLLIIPQVIVVVGTFLVLNSLFGDDPVSYIVIGYLFAGLFWAYMRVVFIRPTNYFAKRREGSPREL